MAEVVMRSLYKVTMTEYERGWGQREMGVKFFDNEEEAKSFCREYFSGNSECYFRAEYEKVN
jgi:gamma-glutamyl phosphate reductase